MGYVIKLISSSLLGSSINHYGYWTGKQYTVQGNDYPVCDKHITTDTKIYKSEKVAKRSADGCIKKFVYVSQAEVEEI